MKRHLGAAAIALWPLAATAVEPADYVAMPAVEYGEREIDFKFGTASKSGQDRNGAASIGFGYGLTQRWFTEFYAKWEHGSGEPTHFDAWEWENKLQVTETGEYPVDVGFLLELERPQDRSEGYEVRLGPLLQTEYGKVQLNGNLLFTRHFRADSPQRTELGYQWQAKYRWQPRLEFGLQGFGDLGPWDHWEPASQQSHRLGPAIFGKLSLGNHQAITYNAGWMVGVSSAAPDHNFRMQVEYEF